MPNYQTLVVDYEEGSDFVTLRYSYNKRFTDWISRSATLASVRQWDRENKVWRVKISRLTLVVKMGWRFFHHVDYRSLPEYWQIRLVKAREVEERGDKGGIGIVGSRTKLRSPHQVLHVLDDAPWEVIKAAYKALAALYHPDHGGDVVRFREVQEAYEKLCSTRQN